MGVTVGPGATIAGRYRLESPLGEGGFGAVFRATDLQSGSLVAVKVLVQGAVESGARFRREAELAMRLSHPNTVRTFDAGEDPESGPFIVLELLEGGSLEQVLRARGPFSQRRAAEIALFVLGSLGEAHGIGIVHRDIKPANVFLVRLPGEVVKVLDFGIAKSTNEGTRAGLTREGQTIGTPAYMAPEQVKGGELGPETDLYALGLVLAEAISGKPVYATDGGLAVLVDKLHGVDPPLPAVLMGSPLEAVVRRATRHTREDRYRSADEMRRAIETALSDLPDVSARQSSMRASAQPGAVWGTESMPFPESASPTQVATADTSAIDVPDTRLSSPRHSLSSSPQLDAIASAPTASVPSLSASGRPPSASELPVSAPIVSAAALSAPMGSGPTVSASYPPAPSAPAPSAPIHSAPIPSGPAFSTESNPSPFASPFAQPQQVLAPAHKPSSGWGLGCFIAAMIGFVAIAGVGGVVAYFIYHITDGPPEKTRTPRTAPTAPTPPRPGAPPALPPPVAPAATRNPAVMIACPGLQAIDSMNVNAKVNAAPGFQVHEQTMNLGAGASVEMTMRQNGADAGRLVFIDGASPGALQTAEASRKPDETDAIYAIRGGKFLYITLTAARAKDLLPSLCGGGGAGTP